MSVMAELDVSRLDLLSWEILILKVSQGRKTREIQEPEIWTQKTRSVKRHLRVTSHLLETSRRIILLGVTYTMFQDVCDQSILSLLYHHLRAINTMFNPVVGVLESIDRFVAVILLNKLKLESIESWWGADIYYKI